VNRNKHKARNKHRQSAFCFHALKSIKKIVYKFGLSDNFLTIGWDNLFSLRGIAHFKNENIQSYNKLNMLEAQKLQAIQPFIGINKKLILAPFCKVFSCLIEFFLLKTCF